MTAMICCFTKSWEERRLFRLFGDATTNTHYTNTHTQMHTHTNTHRLMPKQRILRLKRQTSMMKNVM